MPEACAHSRGNCPQSQWDRLADHLQETAERAAGFAVGFDAGQWARLAGLWHDLGKYSGEFQSYLRSAGGRDAHIEQAPGRVDHSTAGAQHAARSLQGGAARLLAYVIAGHHAGLPDWDDNHSNACLVRRAWRWPCSSAPAHCGSPDKSGMPDLPRWREFLSRADWHEHLRQPQDEATLTRLRHSTDPGRAVGGDSFLSKLERALGRRLPPPCRPTNKACKNRNQGRNGRLSLL